MFLNWSCYCKTVLLVSLLLSNEVTGGRVHICASLFWRKPKSSFVFACLEFRTVPLSLQLLQCLCSSRIEILHHYELFCHLLTWLDNSRFQKFGSSSFLRGPSDRWSIYRALYLCPNHRPLCHSHRFIKMSVEDTVVFVAVPQNTCF